MVKKNGDSGMNAEILETKVAIKKREISIMAEDMKILEKAATVMRSIGHDDSDLKKVSREIQEDIKAASKEAVKLHNAYEYAIEKLKVLKGTTDDKNRSNERTSGWKMRRD